MFGNKLNELRKKNNLSQEELGNYLGVAKNTISNWESGRSEPDIKTINMISQYFGVTTDYLINCTKEALEEIEKLKIALREAGLMKNDDDLTEEELIIAIDHAKQYKEVWKKAMNTPTKYGDNQDIDK